jgi:hypothetical protein
VAPAPRAHVVLSANVFVAAHRAIALGLAASEQVLVRPSRRDPHFTELLAEAAGGMFDVVSEIAPAPGEQVFAYGSDSTLEAIESSLPAGVAFHGHGDGMGVVIWDAQSDTAQASLEGVDRVAEDVVAFEQRGCLSPRVVLVRGSSRDVERVARALATALADAEQRIPRGVLDEAELAAAVRYRDTMCCVSDVLEAGSGFVGVDPTGGVLLVPPVGRNLHVLRATDLAQGVAPIRDAITAIGVQGHVDRALLAALAPGARVGPVGRMQCPPFDGPVDRRVRPRGLCL